jgi:hypothetical protein
MSRLPARHDAQDNEKAEIHKAAAHDNFCDDDDQGDKNQILVNRNIHCERRQRFVGQESAGPRSS